MGFFGLVSLFILDAEIFLLHQLEKNTHTHTKEKVSEDSLLLE